VVPGAGLEPARLIPQDADNQKGCEIAERQGPQIGPQNSQGAELFLLIKLWKGLSDEYKETFREFLKREGGLE
jgi:hypothetical protein